VEHFLGRAYYRQGARRRRGWRNGYQPRKVNTAEVQLEIALPQLRATEESFRSRLAPQFREGGDILGRLVTEMYVGGGSLPGRRGHVYGSLRGARAFQEALEASASGFLHRCGDFTLAG